MGTQQTLHDFTLTLLGDLDAREAFQLDPEGTLEAAGLGDISPVDVQEILPLVLDSASVLKIDAVEGFLAGAGDLTAVDSLKLVTGGVDGVSGVAGIAAPASVTALVTDFGGLGDVTKTLDVVGADSVVTGVTGIASDNSVVTGVTDIAGVHGVAGVTDVADVLVKDLDADVLVKDVADTDVLVKDVVGTDLDVKDVLDVTDGITGDVTGNIVQDVVHTGDVHTDLGQVVGDVAVGDIDVLDGGVGNGDLNIHF